MKDKQPFLLGIYDSHSFTIVNKEETVSDVDSSRYSGRQGHYTSKLLHKCAYYV